MRFDFIMTAMSISSITLDELLGWLTLLISLRYHISMMPRSNAFACLRIFIIHKAYTNVPAAYVYRKSGLRKSKGLYKNEVTFSYSNLDLLHHLPFGVQILMFSAGETEEFIKPVICF